MRSLIVTLGFIVLSALVLPFSTGCQTMNWSSAEWKRQRQYVIETDMQNMTKDIHYVLGLRGPSRLVDETAR